MPAPGAHRGPPDREDKAGQTLETARSEYSVAPCSPTAKKGGLTMTFADTSRAGVTAGLGSRGDLQLVIHCRRGLLPYPSDPDWHIRDIPIHWRYRCRKPLRLPRKRP
jgi:hypothetical protein